MFSSVFVLMYFQLFLTIYQLPDGSNYMCVFPELNATIKAELWAYGVSCYAPDITNTNLVVNGKYGILNMLNDTCCKPKIEIYE